MLRLKEPSQNFYPKKQAENKPTTEQHSVKAVYTAFPDQTVA